MDHATDDREKAVTKLNNKRAETNKLSHSAEKHENHRILESDWFLVFLDNWSNFLWLWILSFSNLVYSTDFS